MSEQSKPILSISILVSNGRVDTIEKCMESLQSLRKAVPSELIIVDTGCTDGSVEIARRYADQVLTFTWCNDFSAARNTGLFACSGEWFLYIDDDEWFENTKELEEFFLSGKYLEYEAAWVKVRNYGNFEGTEYSDSFVGRLSKRTKETKFVYKIHERLDPESSKIYRVNDYLHHYGYVFRTDEEEKKHSERNLTMVEELVREDPEDIRMCCQLAQEYRAAGRFEDAVDICKRTLALTQYTNKNLFRQYLVLCVPRALMGSGKLVEAEQEFERIQTMEPLSNMVWLGFYYEKAVLMRKLGKLELCIKCLLCYFEELDNGKKDKLPVMDFGHYFSSEGRIKVLNLAISVIRESKLYRYCDFFFSKIDWSETEPVPYKFIDDTFTIYEETQNKALFLRSSRMILKQEKLREVYCAALQQMLRSYPEKEMEILRTVEELHETSGYFVYLHLLMMNAEQKPLWEAAKACYEINENLASVTALLLDKEEYISRMLKYVDFIVYQQAVYQYIAIRENDRLLEFLQYIEKVTGRYSREQRYYILYAAMATWKLIVFRRVEAQTQGRTMCPETMSMKDLLDAYTQAIISFYEALLQQDQSLTEMPADLQFAFLIEACMKENQDLSLWSSRIRQAAQICPDMIKAIQCFLEERRLEDK